MSKMPWRRFVAGALLLAVPALVGAQSGLQIVAQPGTDGSTTYSVSIQTLLLFAALSFIPAVLLMMTSFTRIVIVLALMRQALGLQSTPPNQVIIGMSLFLTLFVMGPTFEQIYETAYQPFTEEKIDFSQASTEAGNALRGFMSAQTRQSDLSLFAGMANLPADSNPSTVPIRVLIPAFVVSELKTAFQIGFLVFIPFLIIDLVVASVLMSMGMMMLSPMLVSLPFKIMLFVLVDGWTLLISTLAGSFFI